MLRFRLKLATSTTGPSSTAAPYRKTLQVHKTLWKQQSIIQIMNAFTFYKPHQPVREHEGGGGYICTARKTSMGWRKNMEHRANVTKSTLSHIYWTVAPVGSVTAWRCTTLSKFCQYMPTHLSLEIALSISDVLFWGKKQQSTARRQ